MAYNVLQLPGIQQKSANEPALRSLPTKRSVSGDSEQSQENGERFVATKEPVMNMSNSAENVWGLVREEQRGVPLGFKVLGE